MSMEVVKYVKKHKLYVWHCDNNGQYTQSSLLLLSPVSNLGPDKVPAPRKKNGKTKFPTFF